MLNPTVAEIHYAKLLAFWHGQTPVFRNRGETYTVASGESPSSGYPSEVERYVDRQWATYLPAARAVINDKTENG